MIAAHCFLFVILSKESFLCSFLKRSCCVKRNKGHPHTAVSTQSYLTSKQEELYWPPPGSVSIICDQWMLRQKEGGAQTPTFQLFKYSFFKERNKEVAHYIVFRGKLLFLFQ